MNFAAIDFEYVVGQIRLARSGLLRLKIGILLKNAGGDVCKNY